MNGKHDVALWASIFAFFSTLLAIGVFDVFNPNEWLEYVGALIVAGVTGGSVYAKERMDEAKSKKKEQNGKPL